MASNGVYVTDRPDDSEIGGLPELLDGTLADLDGLVQEELRLCTWHAAPSFRNAQLPNKRHITFRRSEARQP